MQAIDSSTAVTPASNTGKFLTFKLGQEAYALNVLSVREIISLPTITAVPQMPADIRGVVNLRGKIIPVLDLRRRFGLCEVLDTDTTCIIVVQISKDCGQQLQHGLIVDHVEEVIQINSGDVEETPEFGGGLRADYLLGMAKVKGSVKTLLAIDRILGNSVTFN